MKRVYCVLLLLIMLLSSCSNNVEIIKPTEKPENSKNYLYEMTNYTAELMKYKENNSGFCIAGSIADEEKADFIEQTFKDIGLTNVYQEKVKMDGWSVYDMSIVFECDCEKSNVMTLYRMGVYPSNFYFDNDQFELVCLSDSIEGYTDDLTDKAVLLKEGLDIKSEVAKAVDKNVALILYPTVLSTLPIFEYYVDLSLNLTTEVPVITISKNSYNLILDNAEKEKIVVNITGTSTLKEDVESAFVIGEIEGKVKDKYIYVTANRDSVDMGYFSANLSVTELKTIAEELVEDGYVPEYTIRFMVTTGQEWGSISGGYNIGIQNYIESIDLDTVIAVLVLDGSRPIKEVIYTETQIGNDDSLKEKIEKYNEDFKSEGYRFQNAITDISIDNITEGIVWNEKNVPVIIQAEPQNSKYLPIENTSFDTVSIGVDEKHLKFLVQYYKGLIKQIG